MMARAVITGPGAPLALVAALFGATPLARVPLGEVASWLLAGLLHPRLTHGHPHFPDLHRRHEH